jgi:G3E family GTPase
VKGPLFAAATQLLETSGVADVEPLASLLSSSGFKLAGVVAVVDAEAGSSQLKHEDVALAQVCCA